MYVAKFSKKGVIWRVDLLDKQWSSVMLSHEIRKLGSHKCLFHSSGSRWIRNEITKDMIKLHELEILGD